MKKKYLVSGLYAFLALSVMSGCGGKVTETETAVSSAAAETTVAEETDAQNDKAQKEESEKSLNLANNADQ